MKNKAQTCTRRIYQKDIFWGVKTLRTCPRTISLWKFVHRSGSFLLCQNRTHDHFHLKIVLNYIKKREQKSPKRIPSKGPWYATSYGRLPLRRSLLSASSAAALLSASYQCYGATYWWRSSSQTATRGISRRGCGEG
jgi:hypothetical protein